MRTLISCMQCQVEFGGENVLPPKLALIPDDGVIKSQCDRGHTTYTIIQQMKFEILSEMAIQALVDEYYREATSAFMGSLERLYEFFVEAACRKNGIASGVFSTAWRPLRNASERQLGAFVTAFLLDSGRPPALLPSKSVEFRNNVTHKGLFAGRDETLAFARAIIDCAVPVLEHLRSEQYSEILSDIIGERLRERHAPAWAAGMRASTYSMATFFGFASSEQTFDLDAAIERRTVWSKMQNEMDLSEREEGQRPD